MSMNCPKCGSALPDGSSFCSVCGSSVTTSGKATEYQTTYVAPQPAQPIAPPPIAPPPIPPQPIAPPPVSVGASSDYVSSTGATGFVDPSEKAICSLKNGYGLNLIAGEGWKSEDSVITDKRLYYYGDQGIISKVKQEEIVDLEDITGVSITYFRPWIFVIMGALLAIVGLVVKETMLRAVFLGSGFGFLLFFAILSKAFLKIEYAGGAIRFSVKKYGLNNVRVFQRCIFARKDQMK